MDRESLIEFGEPEGGWPQDDEGYWRAILEQGEVAGHRWGSVRESWVEPVADRANSQQSHNDPVGSGDKLTPEPTSIHDSWRWAQESMDRGEVLHLPVIGHNRGGLIVQCGELEGFVPLSHLTDFPRSLPPEGRTRELAGRKGQVLTLQVIEVDESHRRLVLSPGSPRSAGLLHSQGSPQLARALLAPLATLQAPTEQTPLDPTPANGKSANLREGAVCQGRVTNVCDFGVFVDLGGIEGLVHISEISWGRVEHPADRLQPGQEVEVYVLHVDPDQRRVALSTKRLHQDPWATAESRYRAGQVVQGTVTSVMDFGAFVEIEAGLEGLIHVSEMSNGSFTPPRHVVSRGQAVPVRILHIDGSHRRMGLSLRRNSLAAEPQQGSG